VHELNVAKVHEFKDVTTSRKLRRRRYAAAVARSLAIDAREAASNAGATELQRTYVQSLNVISADKQLLDTKTARVCVD
jgi:hypothetical protein